MLSFYINVRKLLFLFILLFISTVEARNIVPVPKPDIEIGKDGEIIFKENKKNYMTPQKAKQTTTTKKFITKSMEKKDEKEIKEDKEKILVKKEDTKKEELNIKKEEDKKENNLVVKKEEKPTKIFITNSIEKKNEKDIKEEIVLTKKEEKEDTSNKKEEEPKKVFITTSINKQDEEKKQEQKNTENNKKIVITNDNFNKNKTYTLESNNEENNIQNNTQNKQEYDKQEIQNLNNKQDEKQELNNKVYKVASNDKVVKSTNYDTNSKNLDIISKIEQNLLYNVKSNDKLNRKIEITKGSWSNEDLKESVVKKDFKITKTSKKVEEFDVEKTERDNKIANLKDRAYQAIQLKEYEIAIKLYKEALKLNNKDNFTKLSLATTYHILGQYAQAKPIYIELLPVFPNSEQLISNLLSIIIQESPYEAIYLLPALANKYSNSAVIQAQTSIAFSSVERYNEAIKYIKNAIYLNEDNVEYKYNLAVLYDITKDYNKAYTSYKDVYNSIRSNPNSSISVKAVEDRIKTIDKLIN